MTHKIQFLKRSKIRYYHRKKGVHYRRSMLFGVIAVFVFSMIASLLPSGDKILAVTDTQTISIDGDNANGTNNWAENSGTSDGSCAGGVDCDYVDESGETDYLGTGTGMNATTAEQEFDLADITYTGTLDQVTLVSATIRAGINGTCQGGGTNCDGLDVRLYIDGAYNGTTNNITLTTTMTDYTVSWSSLTASTASDARIEVIRVANGSGSPSSKDDDVRMELVETEITFDYTPPPTYAHITQEDFVFENDDEDGATDASLQAGSLFSSATSLQNLTPGERTNLRLHLKNTGDGAIKNTDNLALFYDRNDGLWTKVQSQVPAVTGAGDCTDTKWECTSVDADSDYTGRYSSINIGPDGRPQIAYYLDTIDGCTNTLECSPMYARYVGSNGTGCGASASDEWSCTRIDDTNNASNYGTATSSTVAGDGIAYVTYDRNNIEMRVARYVGSGGDCDDYTAAANGSDAWECETIDNSADPSFYSSMTYDPATNVPYTAYFESFYEDLRVARRDGGGSGNCNDTDWNCEIVDSTNAVGEHTGATFTKLGMSATYYDKTNKALKRALRNGGGAGSCNDTDWNCETIDDVGATNGVGLYTSTAVDVKGNQWIAYYDSDNSKLKVAQYVSSGGTGCTGATNSSNWICSDVDDPTSTDVGQYTSIAFSPDGLPWITYYDATNTRLLLARCIGDGADAGTVPCNADAQDANAEWIVEVIDNSGSDAVGEYSSLAFDADGIAWISYYDGGSEKNLQVATVNRKGEITAVPSVHIAGNTALSESHADMTSATDTSNRDSADCVSATTWNAGRYFSQSEGTGLTLTAGDVTTQCTEVMWTLDTTQAEPGTTYRFVVAIDDSLNSSKGKWRGPATIDEYPTITVNAETQSVISTGSLYDAGTSCTNTDWGCEIILDTNEAYVTSGIDMAIDHEGNPWLVFGNSTDADVWTAHYVGSGGNCDETGSAAGGSGSDAWQCYLIDNTSIPNTSYNSIAIGPDGVPHISYLFSDGDIILRYARFVGSGGNCDALYGGSDAWHCENVQRSIEAGHSDIAVGSNGEVYIAYGNTNMYIATYVGENGSCDEVHVSVFSSDAWECTIIDSGDGTNNNIALGPDGQIWVTYLAGTNDQYVARYVGSGGTGCDTPAWDMCYAVATTNSIGWDNGLAVDHNNVAWIAYAEFGSSFIMAKYVGSGGDCDTTQGGNDAWDCIVVHTSAVVEPVVRINKDGNPVVFYYNSTSTDFEYVEYAGTGLGNCDTVYSGNSGNGDWDCFDVDTTGGYDRATTAAFDKTGLPWAAFSITDRLFVGKKLTFEDRPSLNYPSITQFWDYGGNGQLYGGLSAGRSDDSQNATLCGANSNFSGMCALNSADGKYASVVAPNNKSQPVIMMSRSFTSNTVAPTINWEVNTNLAPNTASTAGDLVLEIYRFGTTNAWVSLDTDSTSSSCTSANCELSGTITSNLSEYFELIDGQYWIHIRGYQAINNSTTITMKTDVLRADVPTETIRHGGAFVNGRKTPLNW